MNSSLSPPRPAPHGPRQARPRSRTPSPDPPILPPALVPQNVHPGSLGLDIKRLENMNLDSGNNAIDGTPSDLDGERTPIVPSAKAMGKRKLAEGDIEANGQHLSLGFTQLLLNVISYSQVCVAMISLMVGSLHSE